MEISLEQLCERAHEDRIQVGMLDSEIKNQTLLKAADALLAHEADILKENEK